MVDKMNGESVDITVQTLARLKELFPEILSSICFSLLGIIMYLKNKHVKT